MASPYISDWTGQPFYSGSWEDIKEICKVLGIDEGKMAHVTQAQVTHWQEQIDRTIDSMLERYYEVPLQPYNQYQKATGLTVSGYPGIIVEASRYWTSGQLLLSEFQQLETNVTEQATQYITESKQRIYDINRYHYRLPGQNLKHNLRTMPPSMAPGFIPEQNW